MNLIVIVGPTAVGKTESSLRIAEWLHAPIINCDSRQLYRDMKIATAPPSPQDMVRVKHFFVGCLDLDQYYSAARYEEEVLRLMETMRPSHPHVVLSGGSMMYVDAVCKGIDFMPDVLPDVRETLRQRFEKEGIEPLKAELRLIDPAYYKSIDLKNPKRIIHALEICYSSGSTYTSFRTGNVRPRPFQIVKIGLQRPRPELFDRINRRVDIMMQQGLLEEARRLYPFRSLNALNTVGYKELFRYLDGEWSMEMAVEKIKKNTRDYAKKQMLWFSHDPSIRWFHPAETSSMQQYISDAIRQHTSV